MAKMSEQAGAFNHSEARAVGLNTEFVESSNYMASYTAQGVIRAVICSLLSFASLFSFEPRGYEIARFALPCQRTKL